MYSIKNILTQSPEKVKVTIMSVAGVLVAVLTNADPTLLETVGVGFAIERVLDLLYVAPTQRANTEELTLKSIDLGKQLEAGNQAA